MSTNPDLAWIYEYVEASATLAATTDPIPLVRTGQVAWGVGVWELMTVNIQRTAGVAAATITPTVNEKNDGNKKFIAWAGGTGVAAATGLLAPNLLPKSIFFATAVEVPTCFVGPNVAGDTWVVRTLWRKRQ